jgi:hypothetical protein
MADLSAAAKSILEAYENSPFEYDTGELTACAAVLRAAADQCDPDWLGLTCVYTLHAIAEEMEAFATENR